MAYVGQGLLSEKVKNVQLELRTVWELALDALDQLHAQHSVRPPRAALGVPLASDKSNRVHFGFFIVSP